MRSVIIVAAGSSSRYGTDKLNERLFDKPLIQQTVDVFRAVADEIIVVGSVHVDGATKIVSGGETRSLSVKNGLKAVSRSCKVVAIHDGARPFVSKSLIECLFAEAERFGSAAPRLPVTDTLWQRVKGHNSQIVERPQSRDDFFTVQTPQVFSYQKILDAFSSDAAETDFTDESTLYEKVYGSVHFVMGEHSNKKVTVQGDLPTYRVGNGFDVHAFTEGNQVILGGIHVPFTKKLLGHSDADVLAHAICDAVLSASHNRDIGVQFPDTDQQYKGANSMDLLRRCVELARDNGFVVQNVSAVVICQQPKLSPYIEKMAHNLAQVLGVADCCVNLSATTTEGLGALGNGDGIAAEATALLVKYN